MPGALRCRFGWHDWTAWDYLGASRCDQERHCRRCGVGATRTRHVPRTVYSATQALQQAYEDWARDSGARDKTYFESVDAIQAAGSLYRCDRCGHEWRDQA